MFKIVKNIRNTFMKAQVVNDLRSHLLLIRSKKLVVKARVNDLDCLHLK